MFSHFNFVCIGALPACVSMSHYLATEAEERVRPLELELRQVVGCPVGTLNH